MELVPLWDDGVWGFGLDREFGSCIGLVWFLLYV